jgi:hypothetical protein
MGNIHLLLAHLQHLFTRTMTLDLGGGGVDPEVFRRIAELGAVFKGDIEYPRLLVKMDLGWIWMGHGLLLHWLESNA